jgi:hypothetical protein
MITQGKWYKTIELSGMVQIRGGNTGTTADKSICAIGCSSCTTDEDESNAALIAAAPDLLEACKVASDMMRLASRYFPKSIQNSDKFMLENVCASLDKAIAKAEEK